MHFIFFITNKLINSHRKSGFISAISLIAMLGISIGVAVLIIALSVLNGFQKEIQNKIASFYSHIDLAAFDGQVLSNYKIAMPEIKSLIGNELINISPYVGQVAVIRSSARKEGVYIKGIEPEFDNSDLKTNIIAGKYDLTAEGDNFKIIIGNKLAKKLSVKMGDNVVIFTLRNYEARGVESVPNIYVFKVTGIYETGMSEYDDVTAFTDLGTAQKIFYYGTNLSGYDIKLKNINNADSVAGFLTSALGYPYYGKSIFRIHRNIFTWIELQKKPIPIVLGLIIIVAVFNVISTLLMIVLDKTNAIGILKSLGASGKKIKLIFIINGLIIGILGTVFGNVLGYVLLKLQMKFNIISIPQGVYFLDVVPIDLSSEIFIIVSAISIFLSLICSYIPASLASKTDPIKAIRFS